MKKIFCYILIGFILLVILLYSFILNTKKIISIVYTTNSQGYIIPHEDIWQRLAKNPLTGGSASFSTFVGKQKIWIKRRNGFLLLLDTGNFFQGTQEGNFFRGSSVIEIMNAIGYDAMAVGELDFVFGQDNLEKLSKEAKFPFLCANIISEKTNKSPDYIKPYIIKEYEGTKIGIIGVISPLINQNILPENLKGLRFQDPIYVLNNYVSALREKGANIIIVLSSLGFENDKKLSEEVRGINFIIGGNLYEEDICREPEYFDPIRNVCIVKTWDRLMAAYRLDLILNKRRALLKYKNLFFDLYPKLFKPDPIIQEIIYKYNKKIKQIKAEAIGYTESDLLRSIDSESTLGDWTADLIRKKTGADIAFCAGLQADLKKGPISIADIYNICPILDKSNIKNFNVAILEFHGDQIMDILERSVDWVSENNKNAQRGILQVSGLKITYDPKAPVKHRIKGALINEEPLSKYKIYKVAVNDYLASGGDSYYEILFTKKVRNTGLFTFDILMEELKRNPNIPKKEIEGRIIKLED